MYAASFARLETEGINLIPVPPNLISSVILHKLYKTREGKLVKNTAGLALVVDASINS